MLDFVEKFWEMHRYSPSYREVAENQEIAVSHAFYVVKNSIKERIASHRSSFLQINLPHQSMEGHEA